jgi:hypothetical protein
VDDGSVDQEPPPEHEYKTLTELFRAVFPEYLAMGMTYDQFWHGPPSLVRDYRKSHDLIRHERNGEAWLLGMYIYDALLCVAPVMRASMSKETPKPGEYPKEPYPLTEKEAKQREEARMRREYRESLARMNAASQRELQRRKEQKEKEANEDG